jgi:dihydrofolate synthase / folylpolyglutamate synthase
VRPRAETPVTTYDEALAGLDARAGVEWRTPVRIAPDISRITRLAELLGDPQRTYPSIHITGTNGKTSVGRMVTALLGALGLQAGTYTSPHLQDVRERIRVAGRPIAREDFATAYADVAPFADMVDEENGVHAGDPSDPEAQHVTYFEILTAMAYWWFADHPVDVGVFEVGMGGRWDATNLVRGEVAVFGPVHLDHPVLGSTPAEIAREKAGIIKPGATVVSATQHAEVAEVVDAAVEAAGATLLVAGRDLEVTDRRLGVGGQQVSLRSPTRVHEDILLPLHGDHQADNAALALAAVDEFLGGLDAVDDDVIREGLGAVEVPGRIEVVNREPTVVLDGAHNPAAAARAAEAIAASFAFRDVILVVGCLGDKDPAGILAPFRTLASHVVLTRPDTPRATDLDVLEAAAREVWAGTSVAVERAGTVPAALEKAAGIAGATDGVVVTGSLYTVGAAREVYAPFADGA